MSLNIVDYSQDHEYRHESGVLIVPRAVGTPQLIEVHEPFTIRETRWASSSVNKPPRVPQQADINSEMVYVGGSVGVPLPQPNNNADGYLWRVTGEYTYLCTSPMVLDGTTSLPTGEYPVPLPAIAAFQTENTTFDPDDQSLVPWPYTVFPGNCAVEDLISDGSQSLGEVELVGGRSVVP